MSGGDAEICERKSAKELDTYKGGHCRAKTKKAKRIMKGVTRPASLSGSDEEEGGKLVDVWRLD